MLLISTDYVFDGRNPPYAEDATPNPLNKYGEQKLASEQVVQRILKGTGLLLKWLFTLNLFIHFAVDQYCILRVPILYGQVEYLGEGAVDVIMKAVLNSEQQCDMDNYQRRYPTHCEDVAGVIDRLLAHVIKKVVIFLLCRFILSVASRSLHGAGIA